MNQTPPYSGRALVGLHGLARAWQLAAIYREQQGALIVVAATRTIAEGLADELALFVGQSSVTVFSGWDTLPLEPVSPLVDISASRITAIDRLRRGERLIVVTDVTALATKLLPPQFLDETTFELATDASMSHQQLCEWLDRAGYHHAPVVEDRGDMAVRGSVIDLFPPGVRSPLRVELSEGKISSLRDFESSSQRTLSSIHSARILPAREIIPFSSSSSFAAILPLMQAAIKARGQIVEAPLRAINHLIAALGSGTHIPGIELLQLVGFPDLATFFDYVPSGSFFVLDDRLGCDRALEEFHELVTERMTRNVEEHLITPDASLYLSLHDLTTQLSRFPQCRLDHLEVSLSPHTDLAVVRSTSLVELATRLRSAVGSGKALEPLRHALHQWRKDGCAIAFIVGSSNRAERLQRLLLGIGFDAKILPAPDARGGADAPLSQWLKEPWRSPLIIAIGHAHAGVQLPRERLVFIAESEIFHDRSYRHRAPSERKIRRLLNSLAQLKDGDFVVHADYGIGLYRGLVHLTVEGSESDFLHLDYADSKLYLPVQQIGKIQKFSAAEGHLPVLDKLSSTRWLKTKQKVRESVISLAGDLIKLYAARTVVKGWRFDPMGAEDERFADGFPFEETPDQLKAIREVLTDMAADQPMDRLVCGDVGFGKTEVALRAAMKCLQHGKQVAILAPTTVLVEQHRRTFSERMLEYPVTVRAVSRFFDTATNRETLAALAAGDVDVIIGTHRLLQRDVQFHDLGLLIIDEEHRFGVKQKELLKNMKRQVDVLTLTATPIPRTLHMSLLGIRDISVIATPPHDRRVIRTYVATHHEGLVRDAIMRELQRGGQIFYLYNRVQGLDLIAGELAQLVPEARVRFAHGQMSERELESIMRSFIEHEFDVLVSTTIIESGLDIPNANTIIIDRADTLGLAQLYQLRGRVGRSTRQAYAYLLIPGRERLGADAQQRLGALQSLDELGLGFNLAMQDMEIRGVGNLLGKEQSGNVVAVGFDLYTKIVKEAVMNLKGEELELSEVIDPEVTLGVAAYIPDFYIPDISERLILYQRLAALSNPEEADELGEEITDRFGRFGNEVHNLIELMRLRALMRRFGISKAEFRTGKLHLALSPRAPLDPQKMLQLVKRKPRELSLGKNLTLALSLPFDEVDDPARVFAPVEHVLQQLVRDEQVSAADIPR